MAEEDRLQGRERERGVEREGGEAMRIKREAQQRRRRWTHCVGAPLLKSDEGIETTDGCACGLQRHGTSDAPMVVCA